MLFVFLPVAIHSFIHSSKMKKKKDISQYSSSKIHPLKELRNESSKEEKEDQEEKEKGEFLNLALLFLLVSHLRNNFILFSGLCF